MVVLSRESYEVERVRSSVQSFAAQWVKVWRNSSALARESLSIDLRLK